MVLGILDVVSERNTSPSGTCLRGASSPLHSPPPPSHYQPLHPPSNPYYPVRMPSIFKKLLQKIVYLCEPKPKVKPQVLNNPAVNGIYKYIPTRSPVRAKLPRAQLLDIPSISPSPGIVGVLAG
ncbi:MAG: hypothetical protein Q9218_007164 [Villophora microphyllina]